MIKWFQAKIKDEFGASSFIIVIMLLPLLVGTIGLGIDMSHGVYARQNVQNNTQSAVVSAASQRLLNSSKIDYTAAFNVAMQMYTANRENFKKTLICATPGDLRGGEQLMGGTCKWILVKFVVTNPAVGNATVFMQVREKTPNAFLSVFKVSSYQINASATGRVAAAFG